MTERRPDESWLHAQIRADVKQARARQAERAAAAAVAAREKAAAERRVAAERRADAARVRAAARRPEPVQAPTIETTVSTTPTTPATPHRRFAMHGGDHPWDFYMSPDLTESDPE